MQRTIKVPNLYNIRDLGGIPIAHNRKTAFGQFYRSDSLHAIDTEGQMQLIAQGIRTVIDLRYAGECTRSPNPLARASQVTYHNIPLMSDGVIESDTEDLTHLGAFYRHLLHNSQSAFARVFTVLATQPGATLFHCQVGKDRTGVVAAVLLALVGTPDAHIIADYVETRDNIVPLLSELRQHRSAHFTEAQYERLLDAKAEFMAEFLDELHAHYGGAQQYLVRIGVHDGHIDRLYQVLINGYENNKP